MGLGWCAGDLLELDAKVECRNEGSEPCLCFIRCISDVNLSLHTCPPFHTCRWAQDSYSSLQRTVDTWTFFTVFRAQLFLLDQKWSYLGEDVVLLIG